MTTENPRILGTIRLSVMRDESTSPERQKSVINKWADLHDGTLVDVATDVGVSGAVSPFDRPGLGAWLTDENAGKFDVLVAWKLDRISRNAKDTLELLEWCQERDIRIVTVSDGIDSGSLMGRFLLQITAAFAEMERAAIAERVIESREKLRATGRYAGGSLPYGYQANPLDGGGWTLVQEPTEARVVKDMVNKYLAGQSLSAIAESLNEADVAAPRGGIWRHDTIAGILSNPVLCGLTTHDNDSTRKYWKPILYVKDGQTVQRVVNPIITEELFHRIQDEKTRRQRGAGVSKNASKLQGLVFCKRCEKPLHYLCQKKSNGKQYAYYRCSHCRSGMVDAEELETMLVDGFLYSVGPRRITETVVNDVSAELANAESVLEALQEQLSSATSKTMVRRVSEQMSAINVRLTELESVDQGPQIVDTGRTFAEEWEVAQGWDDKRGLLITHGVKLKIWRPKGSKMLESETYVETP